MDLHVEVSGITVTTAEVGTAYSVTYERLPNQLQLVMTHSWLAAHITTRWRSFALRHSRLRSTRRVSWGGLCRVSRSLRERE